MKRIWLIAIGTLLALSFAHADTPPPGAVKIKGGTDGTLQGNVGDSSKVNVTNTITANVTFPSIQGVNLAQFLGTPPAVGNPIPFRLSNGVSFYDSRDRNWALSFIGDKVDASGSSVSVSNFPASFGATQVTSPWVISGTVTANLGTTNGLALDATLSALSAKFNSLGQKTMANSAPMVLASDQSALPTQAPVNASGSGSAAAATVSTVATLTAPANAVGFVLMNLDVSTTNMRWAIGRTAATNLGQQLQPGRDTGFVPAGSDVSIIAESGTVTYDIQWVTK